MAETQPRRNLDSETNCGYSALRKWILRQPKPPVHWMQSFLQTFRGFEQDLCCYLDVDMCVPRLAFPPIQAETHLRNTVYRFVVPSQESSARV